jgi:hypothetical protein
LLLIVVLLVAIQFYRPRVNLQLATSGPSGLPDSVQQFLQKACYDCHSDSTRLSWFDEPAPAYWLVGRHVRDGKAVLNFSAWDSMSPADRKGKLFESLNQMEYNTMPLTDYLRFHRAATPAPEDIASLKKYLSTFDLPPAASTHNTTASANASASALPNPSTVAPEWTGFEFIPGYKDWKPISASERFDNGTLRLILANDIARNAVLEGHTNPWPDGSAFAKIAWKQASDSNGRIRPGDFIQVELMLRDSKNYGSTYNWAFGRWKGPNLTPYGKNAQFVGECMRCHLPMKSNDFVFTIPVNTTPSDPKLRDVLQWKGIAALIDRRQSTMSILYAKDSTFALATWRQRDDPHWFGARIPAAEAPTVQFVDPGSVHSDIIRPAITRPGGASSTPLSPHKSLPAQ